MASSRFQELVSWSEEYNPKPVEPVTKIKIAIFLLLIFLFILTLCFMYSLWMKYTKTKEEIDKEEIGTDEEEESE